MTLLIWGQTDKIKDSQCSSVLIAMKDIHKQPLIMTALGNIEITMFVIYIINLIGC